MGMSSGEFHKPETPLFETEFQPIKVVVDRRGYLYVLEEAATFGHHSDRCHRKLPWVSSALRE